MAKQDKELAPSVNSLMTRFERVERYWAPAVANMYENWRFYWALYPHLGQGQWPATHIPKMVQAGRQLTQYNFILPLVDSLRAVITKVPTEPTYIALDESAAGISKIAMHMLHSDMELMDWDADFEKFVLFGLIFEGIIKMTVSDRYSPLGNIGFEPIAQGSTFFDPLWKSGKRKDLKRVYKKTWMSAEEIYKAYRLERAGLEARHNATTGETYGPWLGVNFNDYSSDDWGTFHEVREEYYMKPVTKKIELISGPDGIVEMPDIPDEDKPAYMDSFLPGWDKTAVYEESFSAEECCVRTGCPSLSSQDLLVDGEKIEVQVGSPPFFVWAANRINGQSRGVVDSLKDPQLNQNFIESEILRKIQSEGGGGSQFVDDSLFLDPKAAALYRRNRNRPDTLHRVKPGTLRKGLVPAVPVTTTGVPTALYQNISHIQRDIIPNVSKRPPITMGQVEQNNQQTSGKLFQLMSSEADSQIETMVKEYRYCKNDIYEAYLFQAGQTYANEMVPREFKHGKETVIANEPIELRGGAVIIQNDVRGLMRQRHKIIISETQASPSQRSRTANQLLNFMKVIPPENVGTRSVLNSEIIKNIEELDDETKARLDEMAGLEADLAKAKLRLERVTVEAQLMQLEQQMAPPQAGNPGAPVPPGQQRPPYELAPPSEDETESNNMSQLGADQPITEEVM